MFADKEMQYGGRARCKKKEKKRTDDLSVHYCDFKHLEITLWWQVGDD